MDTDELYAIFQALRRRLSEVPTIDEWIFELEIQSDSGFGPDIIVALTKRTDKPGYVKYSWIFEAARLVKYTNTMYMDRNGWCIGMLVLDELPNDLIEKMIELHPNINWEE